MPISAGRPWPHRQFLCSAIAHGSSVRQPSQLCREVMNNSIRSAAGCAVLQGLTSCPHCAASMCMGKERALKPHSLPGSSGGLPKTLATALWARLSGSAGALTPSSTVAPSRTSTPTLGSTRCACLLGLPEHGGWEALTHCPAPFPSTSIICWRVLLDMTGQAWYVANVANIRGWR